MSWSMPHAGEMNLSGEMVCSAEFMFTMIHSVAGKCGIRIATSMLFTCRPVQYARNDSSDAKHWTTATYVCRLLYSSEFSVGASSSPPSATMGNGSNKELIALAYPFSIFEMNQATLRTGPVTANDSPPRILPS